MELSALSTLTPLGDVESWSSQYVKVLGAKELTVTTFSDCQLTLYVYFSINGFDDGQVHKFTVGSSYQTFNLRVSLPWCKFKLENCSSKINSNLIISVISCKKFDLEDHKQGEDKHLDERKSGGFEEKENRYKSPLKSIFSRRKSNSAKQLPIGECKVPEHVPRNAILVGNWDSKLMVIPPPVNSLKETQLLAFVDNRFEWLIVNEQQREDDTMDTVKNVSWKFD